jgi:hypothetical protein
MTQEHDSYRLQVSYSDHRGIPFRKIKDSAWYRHPRTCKVATQTEDADEASSRGTDANSDEDNHADDPCPVPPQDSLYSLPTLRRHLKGC